MTLQQLKYIITVAETGTITEAANNMWNKQNRLCPLCGEKKGLGMTNSCLEGN